MYKIHKRSFIWSTGNIGVKFKDVCCNCRNVNVKSNLKAFHDCLWKSKYVTTYSCSNVIDFLRCSNASNCFKIKLQ